jgi:5'(3')-deoxyribonucleotidase
MLKIIIDIDSTIINSALSIINLHNKLNENKIEYVENHDWNFSPMVTKEQLPELFKLFDHKDFYDESTLVVFKDAINVINELSMQNEVIICSKHDNSRRNITQKWIYETFSSVDIVFTDSFDKGSIIGKCDIILDDKIESLESFKDIAKYRIVFGSYLWNSNWTGLRVNSWLEFKQFVDKLETLDK